MDTYCNADWYPDFGDDQETVLDFGADIRPVISAANDYAKASNKPSINGVTLIGDKTNEDLNIRGISNAEIEALLKNFK